MESQSLPNKQLVAHIIQQMIEACNLITIWNKNVSDANVYPSSPEGMEKMAASCMLIESIGEGIKKIERLAPGFLPKISPQTQWKQIMGLRDHIAHGYFNLDADIIFNVAKEEIPVLKDTLFQIKVYLDNSL